MGQNLGLTFAYFLTVSAGLAYLASVAFGPGGTFWRGRNLPPNTAVTQIEFGNETNNPWQYLGTTPANWQNEPAFLERA